ncbi:PEP-CTERM sorting domain-containing protein [Paucibacter sp. B2R-40]|uniref:PEP-CTERM sorting domain-containing protein n=1 Tax=Paucibacter sp. B2R-40 TaxID=2893554 RepID=UPI0021E4DB98|nr:PEP-CTERM sorting domain-containing protein [Paucibacter sp. B2R-40]MCV2353761.1 PEP-CTERM sorting domain-containing protein [Paucibacter sp. B2R-40]
MNFKQITSLSLLAAAAMLAAAPALATVTVSDAASTYTQTFDSLANSGAGAIAWANDSTIEGWSLFIANGSAAPTYVVNTGATSISSFQSYGSANSTDRALGSQVNNNTYFGAAAGVVAGWTALAVTNTGSARTAFSIGFDGEQWRNNGNATAQTMVMEYGFGATFASVGTWTAPGGNFDWASPVHTASPAAVDGNVAGKVAGKGGVVAANWAAGETLWVRWVDKNDAGNDHGLAIDNVTFSVDAVAAVPEPSTYAMLLAGLGAVGFVARRRKQA